MGKKRSKTFKQKQSRVSKSGASKRFGVAVKKGGAGRDQRLSNQHQVIVGASKTNNNNNNGNATQKQQQQQQHDSKSKARRKGLDGSATATLTTRRTMTVTEMVKKHTAKMNKSTTKPRNNTEQIDFDRQMRSLQERTQRRQQQHQVPKQRQKSETQQSNKDATIPFGNFTAPTFVLDDKHKSTDQLMEETTLKIETGLQGIGSSQQQQQDMNPSGLFGSAQGMANGTSNSKNKLQVLAQQHRIQQRWAVAKDDDDDDARHDQIDLLANNPYAALDGKDDHDDAIHGENSEEDTTVTSNVQQQPFQFAQPTFTIPTTLTTRPTDHVAEYHPNELDPDL